jgi:hypothetical protein
VVLGMLCREFLDDQGGAFQKQHSVHTRASYRMRKLRQDRGVLGDEGSTIQIIGEHCSSPETRTRVAEPLVDSSRG